MNWKVIYTKAAANDFQNLKAAHLAGKAKRLMDLLKKKSLSKSAAIRKITRDVARRLFKAFEHPTSIGIRGVG